MASPSLMLKKALRTAQFYAPALQDQRYHLHRAALRMLGRSWRAEIDGLRLFKLADPLLIDIGAFRGFAIDAMRRLCPSARIEAFEPNQRMANQLRSEFAGDSRISIRALGLGDEPSRLTLYIPEYRGFSLDALGSLDRDQAARWLEGRVYGYDPSNLRVREESCEIVRLDELKLTPAFIKLYAQGFEAPIVTGALVTLREYRPSVIAPSLRPDLNRLFADLGYKHCRFDGERFLPDTEGNSFTWHVPVEKLEKIKS